MLLVAAVFRRSVRQAFHDIRIRVARINSFLQEHLSGMRVVQLFGREEVTAREFAVINKDHLSAHLRSITVYALFFPAVEFLGSVALGALLWYGGLRVLDQTLTVGILAAFIQLTRRFFQPLQDLAEKYNLLQSAMASSERIFRLMDTQPTVLEPVHPKRLARPFRGEVVFEDVWFRYGGDRVPGSEFRVAESDEATSNEPGTRNPELPTDNWVLKGVSFTARPDQTLAIVGHTGAGKTTIISLLLRFYDPQRGRITLDGVDLRELPLAQLRELVGFVQQDLFLFTGNILHNLTLDAKISPERAHEAASRVGADRFINRLPDTYAHILGERGRNLSVGERQLLSFARALARDPRILVLDEATSSVDAEAEAQIQAALAELMRGRTTLVVAHRLSTILHANEILVLHHGEVAERGSHRELLARKGLYERLYRLQLRGPTREHRVGV
jgi:ATP-binding cassette subfamily B protein